MVTKPVGLLVVGPKYAMFIVIEHIRLSTIRCKLGQDLSGFGLM